MPHKINKLPGPALAQLLLVTSRSVQSSSSSSMREREFPVLRIRRRRFSFLLTQFGWPLLLLAWRWTLLEPLAALQAVRLGREKTSEPALGNKLELLFTGFQKHLRLRGVFKLLVEAAAGRRCALTVCVFACSALLACGHLPLSVCMSHKTTLVRCPHFRLQLQ